MTLPPLVDLIVFMGLVLTLALYGLTASGHFPAEARADSLKSGAGSAVLWSTIAIAIVILAAALAFAWLRLPLYAAVIGGGAMVLIAPLLLQPLPDSFVDGRRGLVAFCALALGLALIAGRLSI
jgi:hypothetical protein